MAPAETIGLLVRTTMLLDPHLRVFRWWHHSPQLRFPAIVTFAVWWKRTLLDRLRFSRLLN
jgi:hypothetical protein